MLLKKMHKECYAKVFIIISADYPFLYYIKYTLFVCQVQAGLFVSSIIFVYFFVLLSTTPMNNGSEPTCFFMIIFITEKEPFYTVTRRYKNEKAASCDRKTLPAPNSCRSETVPSHDVTNQTLPAGNNLQ
jgi:hypothetical protein